MTFGIQFLCHAIGDYVLQSHWMATQKTSNHIPALAHALSYGIPFAILGASQAALAVIIGTHFVIDRWRLARHVVWAKNQVAPAAFRFAWADGRATGYPSDAPPWLAVWLMIAADNIMHIIINALAIGAFPR